MRYGSITVAEENDPRYKLRFDPNYYKSIEWSVLSSLVRNRDGCICRYCGTAARGVDHVIPRRSDGPNSMDNLVVCCSDCNGTAKDYSFASFDEKREFILESRGGFKLPTPPKTVRGRPYKPQPSA